MLKYYIKSALISLRRNSIFSAINIFGFAFSISVCLAITIFLIHEYSFDKYHKNSKNIYRLIDSENNSSAIDYRVKDILKLNYPEIKDACIFQLETDPFHFKANGKGRYIENVLSCDNSCFDIFSIKIKKKLSENPLADKKSVTLTESTAKSLFGDVDPLGKEIFVFDTTLFVSSVIEDFPENSSIQANVLVNANNEDFRFTTICKDSKDKSSYRWPFDIYLLVDKNVKIETLVNKINNNHKILEPYVQKIEFLPLGSTYLYDMTTDGNTLKGSRELLTILKCIAFIILVLALINYINLTSSQLNKRGKEIGIKKTIGAFHKCISLQMIIEVLIIIIISFGLALAILEISLPIYKTLFYKGFNLIVLLKAPVIYYLILIIGILSIISGYATSVMFSNATPVKILTKKVLTISGRRKYMQNALVIFQFIVSIVLIFSIIAVQKQIKYVKHKNLGFEKEQLLCIDMPPYYEQNESKVNLLIQKLHQYPNILSMSSTNGVPGNVGTTMSANTEGINSALAIIAADTLFLKTFKIKIVKGRKSEQGDYGKVCLINEAAYKLFKWNNLEHKKFNNGKEGGFEVIGVVENFHFNSLYTTIQPMAILLYSIGYEDNLNIRIAPGKTSTILDNIKKVWDEVFPGYAIKYRFYDEWFDNMYQKEERLASSISLFAILAIIISCMGILGLSIFTTAGRTKEIGIRKVNGANTLQIVSMLNKDLLKWVAIAFIIACPIACYAMHKWLENFAYKTELSWWIFALAGLLALIVALLTVSWQSWKTARMNPVEALRYE
jgi:putative ABC transport system permease protein